MNRKRPPKKSETLEVRLPHEVKDALMRKAQGEGRSASDVVRQSIDSYLAARPKEARNMLVTTLWKPVALGGAAAIAIAWSGLATSPVAAAPNLALVFAELDLNHDGAVSMDEFLAHRIDPATAKKMHAEMGRHVAMMHGEGSNHQRPSESELRDHFGKADANRDGSLTLAEIRAFHDTMVAPEAKVTGQR